MKTKGKPKTQQVGAAINARLSEYFDGHVVVGFLAGTNTPMIIHPEGQDPKTVIALNQLLVEAVRGR